MLSFIPTMEEKKYMKLLKNMKNYKKISVLKGVDSF